MEAASRLRALRVYARTIAMCALAACHHAHGPRVFVSNEDDGTVSVIDAGSFDVIDTVHVGQRPRGLRVSKDGKWLYVALSGSPKGGPGIDESQLPPPDRNADGIGVIDLDKLSLVRTVPSGPDPEAFDLLDDHTLVVSNEETAEASLVDLDAQKLIARVGTGREPEGVAVAPDKAVWVTSESDNLVSVVDPLASSVLGTISTGARPRAIAFTPDGSKAFITDESDASVTIADVASRKPIGRLVVPKGASASPPRPMGIAIARDGKRGFVTTGRAGSVAVIDPARGTYVATIDGVGKRPWGIAIAKSGLVFTANGPSNDVSVIDPDTRKVVRRIHAGGSPWGVAISD